MFEQHRKSSFELLADAVVPIAGIRDLKAYLLRIRPTMWGLRVDHYDVFEGNVRARLVYPDHTRRWAFFGELENVAHNAQKGLYEAPDYVEPPEDGRGVTR